MSVNIGVLKLQLSIFSIKKAANKCYIVGLLLFPFTEQKNRHCIETTQILLLDGHYWIYPFLFCFKGDVVLTTL